MDIHLAFGYIQVSTGFLRCVVLPIPAGNHGLLLRWKLCYSFIQGGPQLFQPDPALHTAQQICRIRLQIKKRVSVLLISKRRIKRRTV